MMRCLLRAKMVVEDKYRLLLPRTAVGGGFPLVSGVMTDFTNWWSRKFSVNFLRHYSNNRSNMALRTRNSTADIHLDVNSTMAEQTTPH